MTNENRGRYRDYWLSGIDPEQYYHFSEIVRQFKVPRSTLEYWRKTGRLAVSPTNNSRVQGQRLIEAIDNRLSK